MSREGISVCEDKGFPTLSSCYVTKWEFPLKNVCFSSLMLNPVRSLQIQFIFILFFRVISSSYRDDIIYVDFKYRYCH